MKVIYFSSLKIFDFPRIWIKSPTSDRCSTENLKSKTKIIYNVKCECFIKVSHDIFMIYGPHKSMANIWQLKVSMKKVKNYEAPHMTCREKK